jgi:hypothetical protein
LDIPEYAKACEYHRARYRRAAQKPKTSFAVSRFVDDDRMAVFLQLIEWHAYLVIGKSSTLVDTAAEMVWSFGLVGDGVPPVKLGEYLGITSNAARSRILFMRKHMPCLLSYAKAAGIIN